MRPNTLDATYSLDDANKKFGFIQSPYDAFNCRN